MYTSGDLLHLTNDVQCVTLDRDVSTTVSGHIRFVKTGSSRHVVLLCTRCNAQGREMNGPFPGWFVQIVGSSLSVAWGDGHTWHSHQAGSVQVDVEYDFYFEFESGTVRTYLNGISAESTNRTVFRYSGRTLTIGALSSRRDFLFDGSIQMISIGTGLDEARGFLIPPTVSQTQTTLDTYTSMLERIETNMKDVETDIDTMETIELLLLRWKALGVHIESSALQQQVVRSHEWLQQFQEQMNQIILNTLEPVNDRIKADTKTTMLPMQYLVLERFEYTMRQLKEDREILLSARDSLAQYKHLGVELGTAFETIDKQVQTIDTAVEHAMLQLQECVQQSQTQKEKVQSDKTTDDIKDISNE